MDKYTKLMSLVADHNARTRTEAADPKDLKHRLTRLGERTAISYLGANAPAGAFAKSYSQQGLDTSERMFWAKNERRVLSFVHYGQGLQHTALLHAAPSDATSRSTWPASSAQMSSPEPVAADAALPPPPVDSAIE